MSLDRDDILESARQEAQRLRVARLLPDASVRKLTLQEIADVRDDFVKFIERYKLSQADTARRIRVKGCNQAAISLFVNWKADHDDKGHFEKMARVVNRWMEQYERNQERIRENGFVENAPAKAMMTLIDQTIANQTMAVVVGCAGTGKTITLEFAASVITGAILLQPIESTSANNLVNDLWDVLKLKGQGTYHTRKRQIIEELKMSSAAILIDEGHLLSKEALLFLRRVHDLAGSPVVIVATKEIDQKIFDRHESFGQLSSRLGLYLDLAEYSDPTAKGKKASMCFTVEDLRTIWEGDRIRFNDDALDLLCQIVNVPGWGGVACDAVSVSLSGASRLKHQTPSPLKQCARLWNGCTARSITKP